MCDLRGRVGGAGGGGGGAGGVEKIDNWGGGGLGGSFTLSEGVSLLYYSRSTGARGGRARPGIGLAHYAVW